MADQVLLQVQQREVLGKGVRRLRRSGVLPANVFGHDRESLPIQVNALEFSRMLQKHPSTTLYRLRIAPGGREETAIVRHVQHEPVTGAIQHVDFQHVELSESMRARVPVRLEGEPPAVKLYDGVLFHPLDTLEIEALPSNLPEAIVVDVTVLGELNSVIFARDLVLPAGVTLLTDGDERVAAIEAPRVLVEETTTPEAEASPTAEAGGASTSTDSE